MNYGKTLNLRIILQSISPGTVRTNLIDPKIYEQASIEFPALDAKDVAHAVLYVLGTPKHVEVSELRIKPVGEMF